MHADMTALIIQSTKIVSNEIKENQALPEPLYGKHQMNFLAKPIFGCCVPLLTSALLSPGVGGRPLITQFSSTSGKREVFSEVWSPLQRIQTSAPSQYSGGVKGHLLIACSMQAAVLGTSPPCPGPPAPEPHGAAVAVAVFADGGSEEGLPQARPAPLLVFRHPLFCLASACAVPNVSGFE